MATDNDADVLSRLLGDENAAVETYERALEGGAAVPEQWPLQEIAQNHRQCAATLAQALNSAGASFDQAPRAYAHEVWATVARAHSTKLVHDHQALANLRSCEAWEADQCRQILARDDLDPATRTLVSSRVLPNLEEHLNVLDRFLDRFQQGA